MPFAKITLELPVDLSDTETSENVVDALGEFLKNVQVRGASTDLRVPASNHVPARDPPAEDDPLLGGGDPGPTTGTDGHTPPSGGPKRVRDRTAERRAKREREAAEAAEAARKTGAQTKPNGAVNPTPPPDDDPLMGAADDGADAGHADPFDTPIPPADAPPQTRTPQQLMDASIIILRQCYGASGGVEQVKVIQKEFKVSQFTQVPLDKAAVLYNRALALANTLSVKLPAGV